MVRYIQFLRWMVNFNTTTSQPSNVSPSFPDSPKGSHDPQGDELRFKMQVERFRLFRQDIRDLVELTVQKMDLYHMTGRNVFFSPDLFFFGLGKEAEEIVCVFMGSVFVKNGVFFWCVLNESLDDVMFVDECVLSCLFVAMSWWYSFCGDGVSTWTCMDAKFCFVSHCTKLNACAVGALFIRMISIYYSEGFFSEPPPTFLQVAYYLSQAVGKGKHKQVIVMAFFLKIMIWGCWLVTWCRWNQRPALWSICWWLFGFRCMPRSSPIAMLHACWPGEDGLGERKRCQVFFFFFKWLSMLSASYFFKVKSWSSVLFAFRKLKSCLGKKQDLILPGLCDFQFLVVVKSTFWMHAMRILKGKVDRCYEFHFGKAGMNVERVEARLLSDVSFIPWIWINCHSL